MNESLINARHAHGATVRDMAVLSQCSVRMIQGLEEDGWITVPAIAVRVIRSYGLGVEDYNRIVPEDCRVDVLPEYTPKPTVVPDWMRN